MKQATKPPPFYPPRSGRVLTPAGKTPRQVQEAHLPPGVKPQEKNRVSW